MFCAMHSHCVICEQPLTAPQRLVGRTCGHWQCRLAYRRHLESGGGTCAACGRPLTLAQQVGGAPTCGNPQCQLIFFSQTRQAGGVSLQGRCGICNTLLPPERAALGVCRDRECCAIHAAVRAAETAKRTQKLRERLVRLAERRREESAAALGIGDPEGYPLTLAPFFSRLLTNLPQRRRREFGDRLARLVGEAAAANEAGWPAAGDALSSPGGEAAAARPPDGAPKSEPSEAGGARPEALALPRGCCAVCRGSCCRGGGNDAYLSVDTIRRYMARHPRLSPQQVLAEYLDRVPDRTFRGSCIYHGATGCGLRREMRSETCNNFYCAGLQQLRDELQQGGTSRAFVVVARRHRFVSGTFLDAEGTAARCPASPDTADLRQAGQAEQVEGRGSIDVKRRGNRKVRCRGTGLAPARPALPAVPRGDRRGSDTAPSGSAPAALDLLFR